MENSIKVKRGEQNSQIKLSVMYFLQPAYEVSHLNRFPAEQLWRGSPVAALPHTERMDSSHQQGRITSSPTPVERTAAEERTGPGTLLL